MKIRSDFVTNSSSSSYIVIRAIEDTPEFREMVKEELGKFGQKMMDEYLIHSSKIKEELSDMGYDYLFDPDEYEDEVPPITTSDENMHYLVSTHYTYDSEGDGEGRDAFFDDILGELRIGEVVYRSESY